jgi:glycosyltransferase involved in cell wall biosynthesis
MGMKQLLLDQRETTNALHDLRSAVSSASEVEDVVECLGAQLSTPPRVSVLLTVRDQASLVGGAIDSVSVSELTDYELMIVDDGSRDGSGNQIRTALARAPWVCAKLITRSHHGGWARARNLAAEAAAGELVFVLDADSSIYPHALGRLVQVMDERPAVAFAYGIIEEIGIDGASSVASYLGWDASRLRYGNFVEETAMVRRSALLEVGGYVTDPCLDGWEDFALWCAFADRGWDAVRVPEIVARHRRPRHSRASVATIDTTAAWGVLLDRFECLSA